MTATYERTLNREDYVAVPVSALTFNGCCPVAFYTRDRAGEPMRLFRAADFPINQETIDFVETSAHQRFYVRATDHRLFQAYLREMLDAGLADESLNVPQRFSLLNEVVRDVLQGAFQHNDVDEIVSHTEQLGERAVDMICRDDTVGSDLRGVLYHDYQTFTHSANVSYYCIMLCKALGLSDREDLLKIAKGGLLHDLGKLDIPEAILTKPDKLTDKEFDIIKRHPTVGFRKLCRREDMDFGQLMMVYQHHERIDGKGYPVGVANNEIHVWAKICAVSDVYEALTSNRPYRARLRPESAFEIMEQHGVKAFDKEIFRCWKSTILEN